MRVESEQLTEAKMLGAVPTNKHGESRFWPLVAAINKDRGYFSLGDASTATSIRAGAVIEVWHPSRYYGTTTDTRVRIAGPVKRAAYDEIMVLIESGAKWGAENTFSELEERFREDELVLHYSPAARNGAENLRELSLKYYGSTSYWRLIAWVNQDVLGSEISGTTDLPDEPLHVVHFLP